jgi:hypothetical protein
MGVTLAHFQLVGNIPVLRDKLKSLQIKIITKLENNIIINNQSGFTKGDSAIYQLINITNDFGKALDEGKEVRVIFCDISKAFDRVILKFG